MPVRIGMPQQVGARECGSIRRCSGIVSPAKMDVYEYYEYTCTKIMANKKNNFDMFIGRKHGLTATLIEPSRLRQCLGSAAGHCPSFAFGLAPWGRTSHHLWLMVTLLTIELTIEIIGISGHNCAWFFGSHAGVFCKWPTRSCKSRWCFSERFIAKLAYE